MKQEFNITKIGKKELEAELELLISQPAKSPRFTAAKSACFSRL